MIEFVVLMASMAGAGQLDPAQCAQLPEDAARLACYDAVFRPAATTPAAAAPAAPVAAATTVVASQEDFGLSGTQRAARAESSGVEQPRELTGVIDEIYGSRVGKPAFRLDNGQRWRQTEATNRPMFNVGETVVIRGASMGSFLASVPGSGRPAVRVRREE
jgi:hypothetical protein